MVTVDRMVRRLGLVLISVTAFLGASIASLQLDRVRCSLLDECSDCRSERPGGAEHLHSALPFCAAKHRSRAREQPPAPCKFFQATKKPAPARGAGPVSKCASHASPTHTPQITLDIWAS